MAVFMVVDGVHEASFYLTDETKDNAKSVIDILNKQYQTVILTGDQKKVATWVSNELGISIVKSELLPHQKSDFIDKLDDKVAYVGDGLNDGIALAKSDVGISFGDATDLAMEQADIVLLNNDLVALTQAIQISKYARKLMLQNMLIALSTLFILLFGFIKGDVHMGMFVHELSVLVVTINALRFNRIKDI